MTLISRELQCLCMVCFIVTAACLSITSSGTFEINTEVKFICVHDSYTGSHRWKVDAAEVLICISSLCVANASNPTRFSFVSDPDNGVFIFTINPVLRLDDDSIIGCNNGSVEETFKLKVKEPGDSQIIMTGAIVGGCVGGIAFIALVCCCCCVCKLTPPQMFESNDIKDDTVSVSWKAGCRLAWFHLSYENEHLTVCRRHYTIKDLKPLTKYDITLYATTMCRKSKVSHLHVKTHGKPDPPKKFQFNENINNDEMPYVSWEPGFTGGCDQTFILRFEKILIKTHNQTDTARGKPMNYKENVQVQEITNTTAPELNKPIDEKHSEVLDLKSQKEFTIQSDNLTTFFKKVKGLDPSSQYEITLYSKNKYGDSEVKTLHEKTHDKPSPPKEFQFNQNISSDTFPNVSWVPGYNGGCYQTFILQFEKQLPETEIKTLNQAEGIAMFYNEHFQHQEITNTIAAELNKPKIVEGHSEILDVESDKKFAIPSHNVTTTIRMQIKGLEPSSLYEIKLYGKNKYGKSEVKTLHAKTHGKPDPPKKFKFNENINNDEKPYVSWEPGFNGGCEQTFFLRFEKILIKTHNQTDTARDKPMPIEIVKGHPKILNVESNHIFSITSHKETEEIRLLIKGREPSSTYKIMLYSENAYGQSKVMTLHADAADGSSLSYRPGHTNQPKHDKKLQRHGLSVEESNGSGPLQPPI